MFAVSRWLDQITEVKERQFHMSGTPKQEYFETDYEAKAFILDRAFKVVQEAEKELAKAVARQRKCSMKFSILGYGLDGKSTRNAVEDAISASKDRSGPWDLPAEKEKGR